MRPSVNHVLRTLALLTLSCALCRSEERSGLYTLQSSDNIFLDALVFEASSVSLHAHCLFKCLADATCESFTYTASGGVCRGHSIHLGSATPTPSLGTKAFSLLPPNGPPWHEHPCLTNAECPAPLSECFEGVCLCSPGYFFSEGSNGCVAQCALSDLTSQFALYDKHAIWGAHAYMVAGPSLEECKEVTLNDSLSPAVTYDNAARNCYVHHLTVADVPGSWVVDLIDWDYLQRTCV